MTTHVIEWRYSEHSVQASCSCGWSHTRNTRWRIAPDDIALVQVEAHNHQAMPILAPALFDMALDMIDSIDWRIVILIGMLVVLVLVEFGP